MIKQINFAELTLMDALDLAILIEEEAETRYGEFVSLLGDRYPGDASDFFRSMVINEAKHKNELSARRKKLFPTQAMTVSRDMIVDVEAPDYGKPRAYMSVQQAMQVALQCEQKAHDFFEKALPSIKNKEVKELFTELASEELEHLALVKNLLKKMPPQEGPDLGDDDVDEPPEM